MDKLEAAELLELDAKKCENMACLCRGVREPDAEQWRRLAHAMRAGAAALEGGK